MNVHQLKCPNCNASLEVENGLDTFFCNYCGTKIFIDDQNEATIQAKVDIRKAELEKDLKEKELEIKHKQDERDTKMLIYSCLAIALIGVLFGIAVIFFLNS